MAGGYDIGPRIGIDGEAEFRKQIQGISNGMKTLGTEMKVVTTQFIGQENSEKALTAQTDVLERTVLSLNEKLDLQKKMLQASAEAYGEADSRTQKWQQAVNTTQAEINKANAQIAENTAALEDNGEEVEETAEKHEGAFSRMANAAKAGAAAIGAALTVASAAVGSVVKEALGAYGDYEQLVGGVETLFGAGGQSLEEYAAAQGKTVAEVEQEYNKLLSAQEGVLSNANNAYKTAGLSANEYMETVTSVSAALINSLGGDTVKAAEVADLAITDMADNANKMGSSMESIQNAYAGFAKGQYTMLDNLKLGYGGTKTEMERLLKDAEKLTGKKFNLDSYADIVEAIHAIQTEMGITGTTAREASATIQGSTAAMESAWKNLIAGMGDENADLDQLINNLVDSVVTMLDNVVPRVGQILTGIGEGITQLAPVISEMLPEVLGEVLPSLLDAGAQLVKGLAGGLTKALPVLITSGAEIIGELAGAVLDLLPELITTAVEIINTLAAGLVENLPSLIPSAVAMVLELVETLLDNVDQLIDPAVEIIVALAEGLINALPVLLEKGPVIISKLVSAIIDAVPKLVDAAMKIIGTLVTGIIDNLPQIGQAAGELIATFGTTILGLVGTLWDVGSQIVSGIWEGIKGKASWFKEKITGFFSGIVDGVKDVLGIHSPSTVFASIGGNMADGLGVGWDREYSQVKRDIEKGLNFDASGVSANFSMPGITASMGQPDLSDLMAGMVNGVQTAMASSGNDLPQSATIVLQAGDGTTLARWLLPDLRAAMRDDPEVV